MAEQTASDDLRVGLLVLGALTVLIVGSLWILGSSSLGVERVPLEVRLLDSGGIEVGDRVRLAGVSVGRITAVSLEPDDEWPVHLQITVRKNVGVRTDASATLATIGLLGTSFLQIVPAANDTPIAPPGHTIYGAPGAMGLDGAFQQLGELAVTAKALLEQTSGMLDQFAEVVEPSLDGLAVVLSPDNVREMTALISETRRTIDEAGPKLAPLLDRLNSLTTTVEGSLERAPETIAKAATTLEALSKALGRDGERLQSLLESAETGLASTDEALSVIGDNSAALAETVEDLRATAAYLREFSRQVSERPSSLVRKNRLPVRRPGDGVPGGRR